MGCFSSRPSDLRGAHAEQKLPSVYMRMLFWIGKPRSTPKNRKSRDARRTYMGRRRNFNSRRLRCGAGKMTQE